MKRYRGGKDWRDNEQGEREEGKKEKERERERERRGSVSHQG